MSTNDFLKTSLFIQNLANQHNVVYQPNDDDTQAKIFTQLSDDPGIIDDISYLIIALYRSKIITRKESMDLFVQYQKEKQNV